MTTATTISETADTLAQQMDDQGYVILRQVLEPGVVAGARAACEQLVDQMADKLVKAGRVTDTLAGQPFERRLHLLAKDHLDLMPKNFRRELHLSGFFGVFFHPRVLDLAERLLGPEVRLYPNYTVRPKLPDWEGTLVLWHQDGGYTDSMHRSESGDVSALRMVNVWTPLVPARVANGCMQFIPGTHKLGIVPHEKKEVYLEISDEHLRPRLKDAVNVEMDPGDVVLFSNLLFHCGLPNTTDTVRWSLDWRYQDATQSTMREHRGHLARSRAHSDQVIRDAQHWAKLSFQ